MKPNKTLGIVLLVGGVVVLLISLLADLIVGELSGSGSSAFSVYQIAGAIIGAVSAVAGFVLLLIK
jgi:hypothetical protein